MHSVDNWPNWDYMASAIAAQKPILKICDAACPDHAGCRHTFHAAGSAFDRKLYGK